MKRLKTFLAIVCAICLFGVVIAAAYLVSQRPPALGPDIYAREVLVLFDTSQTMDLNARGPEGGVNFRAGKAIITTRILPALGPGARLGIYRIGTGFSEGTHRIVNGDLGKIPERLLDPAMRKRVPKDTLKSLWGHTANAIEQGKWIEAIDDVPMERRGNSDYFSALDYAAQRVRASVADGIDRFELIIIGDRLQDPAPDPFVPPAPSDDERFAFDNVAVRFVSPFRTDAPRGLTARTLEQFWSEYFAARGALSTDFVPFDGVGFVVPESRVSRPEPQS